VTHNFPVGLDYTVRMGEYGTKAINGIEVATTNSGSGGSFEVTYNIPDELKATRRLPSVWKRQVLTHITGSITINFFI